MKIFQMNKSMYLICIFFSVVLFGILFSSCNAVPDSIPFPRNEFSYAKPVSVPLIYTPEKKLAWDTVKQGGVKSVIKKLDINALPSTVNDSSDFKPLARYFWRQGPRGHCTEAVAGIRPSAIGNAAICLRA